MRWKKTYLFFSFSHLILIKMKLKRRCQMSKNEMVLHSLQTDSKVVYSTCGLCSCISRFNLFFITILLGINKWSDLRSLSISMTCYLYFNFVKCWLVTSNVNTLLSSDNSLDSIGIICGVMCTYEWDKKL